MKIYLFSALLFMSLATHAQKKTMMTLADLPASIDTTTGGVSYLQIIDVPNTSAALLFERTKSWLVDSFQSAKAIIDSEDKETGSIAAKPVFTITSGKGGFFNTRQVTHKTLIDIRCKDNRLRCEVRVLELVPSMTERSLGAVGNLPIEIANMTFLRMISKKGFLYENDALHFKQVDEYYKSLLQQIKKAALTPGKGEF